MRQKGNWMPIVASIGIGAVAYNMMNRNGGGNRMMGQMKNRFQNMRQSGQMFPNS